MNYKIFCFKKFIKNPKFNFFAHHSFNKKNVQMGGIVQKSKEKIKKLKTPHEAKVIKHQNKEGY